jgi:hypothetical protein
MEAVRATADSLSVTLEQMKLVEALRRAYLDLTEVEKLGSN